MGTRRIVGIGIRPRKGLFEALQGHSHRSPFSIPDRALSFIAKLLA
jgi:hypothetical protein